MADSISLPAKKRELTVKPRVLRARHQLPAEYYGAGKENLHLAVDYQIFRKIYKKAGESTIISLQIADDAEPREVLIHAVDFDPLTDEFRHVDFLQIAKDKKITTRVPISFAGVSPAVKTFGGIFTHGKTELEIRCLPKDLISTIVVDVTTLENINDSIHVSDLKIDRSKIEILDSGETIVCHVVAPKTQAEIEEELAEPAGDAVSAEVKAEAEAEKAAAVASKESDKEKKGSKD